MARASEGEVMRGSDKRRSGWCRECRRGSGRCGRSKRRRSSSGGWRSGVAERDKRWCERSVRVSGKRFDRVGSESCLVSLARTIFAFSLLLLSSL